MGVVKLNETDEAGKRHQNNYEIDFFINRGMKKVLHSISSDASRRRKEKTRQELRPLLGVRIIFRKVLVTKTAARPWLDDNGVLRLGIYDFRLDDKLLDM